MRDKLIKMGHIKNVFDRYKIDENVHYENEEELLEVIGKKRGALISGGEVDLYKAGGIVLDDFRKGRIGKITLEKADIIEGDRNV